MAPISDSYLVIIGRQGIWSEIFIRNNTTGCSSVKDETTYDNHKISIVYEEKKHYKEAIVRVSFDAELSDRFPLRVVPEVRTFTTDGGVHDDINAVQNGAHKYITHIKRTLEYDIKSLEDAA